MSANGNSSTQLRVAIIGAGIGGLAFAVALHKLVPEGQVKIDVYEQAHEIKEIGVGIGFWARSWEIFKELGVSDALEKHLPVNFKRTKERKLVWSIRKADEKNIPELLEVYRDDVPSSFHRSAVQKTLIESLPPSVAVHLNHRITSYSESDESVTLNFEGQESQTCDLLVGADGIRSRVRAELISKRFPDEKDSIYPLWDGLVAFRTLINAGKVREEVPDHISLKRPLLYVGDGKWGVTYPIMQGKYINMAALVTDYSKEGTKHEGLTVQPTTKEHLASLFNGWSDEHRVLLKNIESCSMWTVEYLKVLEKYAIGRVALLGDAAHAMPPSLGSGAGQAVEDAYTLAHLLSKAIQSHIPIHRVCEAYTTIRRPLANTVLEKSREMARLVSFRAPGYEHFESDDKEAFKRWSDRFLADFHEKFKWAETQSVQQEEVEKWLDMLEARG